MIGSQVDHHSVGGDLAAGHIQYTVIQHSGQERGSAHQPPIFQRFKYGIVEKLQCGVLHA